MIKNAEKPEVSDRVEKEKRELLSSPSRLDLDNVKILLDVYNETKGQPPVMRRARYFAGLCAEKGLHIDENPFIGTLTKYKYGAFPSFETNCRWMPRVDSFSLQRGLVKLTKEDRKIIGGAVDYWKDINSYNRTREIIKERLNVDLVTLLKCGVGVEFAPSGFNGGVPDFHKVLDQGLAGYCKEIEKKMVQLDTGDLNNLNRYYFYKASLICLNAVMAMSLRYSALLRKMAGDETDPEKKAAMERMAKTCEHVPAQEAGDFREALQSVWFVIMAEWMENGVVLLTPPSRFTQYMYPFYERDIKEGRLNNEETIELLHFFFLKLNGLAQVMPPHGYAWNQSRLGLHLSLGGLTPDGDDATNELDYLVLEAQTRIRLPEPLVNVMYHNKLSQEFLIKCVDLVRTGIGQPAFHNTEKAVQRHLYHDKPPLEEARNVSIAGCVQSNIPGYSAIPWEGHFNTSKMIELALNNGKDPLTEIQLGPETGEAESFASYDELYQAVIRQLEYFIPIARIINRTAWNIKRDFPTPFASTLVNDCIKKGKDIMDGGARYNALNGVSMVAVIDLANSLAAVKKLVFDDKKITVAQLKEALTADFKGYEDIHRMCVKAPKYGNDDDYADSIVRDIYAVCYREHQRFPDYLGRTSKPEAYSVTTHFAVGRYTGALPNGRNARLPLTDASISAMPGTDKYGPTTLAISAAKVIDTVRYGSSHLNMKFHPAALEGLENGRKFLSMIKAYFNLGGYHVQFNCVSSKTLKMALFNPSDYRDLVVRVAGFSAFFIHLDRSVQDEIIKRTELSFG